MMFIAQATSALFNANFDLKLPKNPLNRSYIYLGGLFLRTVPKVSSEFVTQR